MELVKQILAEFMKLLRGMGDPRAHYKATNGYKTEMLPFWLDINW